MFETVELGQKMPRVDFKQQESLFRVELLRLQRQLKEQNTAVLIIVAGIEGAGKGDVVNQLNKWFDSRGMATYAFWDESDEERERPHYWRYWRSLPARGNISIMFGGWYWDLLQQHAQGKINDVYLDDELNRIRSFESMLQHDGLLIVKLWFHLSKPVFKKAMRQRREVVAHLPEKLALEPSVWYQHFNVTAEHVLRETDRYENRWCLIEADNPEFRDFTVAQTLIRVMQRRLSSDVEQVGDDGGVLAEETGVSLLDQLQHSVLSNDSYKKKLKAYEQKLTELTWQVYDQKRSVIIVFEGWDAAGKGGAIRRLIKPIDARLYRVISIAAPTDEERAHHYLWRFWRHVPRAGYMTFYDRSWYGRVLVERVEQFAKVAEWQRAYQEINAFEKQLLGHGVILLKFWLHITPEEQLARFEEREKTPWKQHKITEEDWRNRNQWDGYKLAVNEMVRRTSTQDAPWYVIPANDKLFARVEILKYVTEALSKTLDKS